MVQTSSAWGPFNPTSSVPEAVPPAVDDMGEDSCPGSQARAASGVDVFCLNDAGRLSCSGNRDCPDPVKQTFPATLFEGKIVPRGYTTFRFFCDLESRECHEDSSEWTCQCAEDGENCLLRQCDPEDKDDGDCVICFMPFVLGSKPLTRATATGGQTLRSQALSQRSGCGNTRPCRYRSWPFCGRLVGLGSGGRVLACPRELYL